MVDTAMPRARADAAARYVVERLRDPDRIRRWLAPERAYAAYALGQLEPSLFGRSQWWTASGPTGRALVAISRGGLGNACLTMGDAEALEALLSLHPGPRYAFATFRPEHLGVARRYYRLARPEPMIRMAVTAETFQPVEGEGRRLGRRDTLRANFLYSTEGGPTFYTSGHLAEGVYYGVFAGKRLAAIAGTHVFSPTEGVAVVGNVFTHPEYRNRGLAKLATSAVTAALLKRCAQVFLTVESTNIPALKVYDALGYRESCILYETPVTRREPRGALALWRRALARWRGRRQGRELVMRR